MDSTEAHFRAAAMLLDQLRHEESLRRSDLQRGFVLGLSVAAGMVLSALQDPVPDLAGVLSIGPFTWAAWQAHQARSLSRDKARRAQEILEPLIAFVPASEPLRPQEVNGT